LEAIEQGRRFPSAISLHKEWNGWKRQHAPWWTQVSKCAPQEALRDLERAFRGWWRRFKRKKLIVDNTARLTGSIRAFPPRMQLPRIGKVRSKERTEKLLVLLAARKARILSATIAREADRWFVSLTCLVERSDPELRQGEPVGVDLGLTSFLVLSDGARVNAPKPLQRALWLLRRRSQQLSRKQRGSNNRRKAILVLAPLRNIRRDFLHKVTTELARTKPAIVVEDLAVKDLAGGRLAQFIGDVGWGTFRRMLEYKCRWYGARLIIAPRDFPSTRLCSACGHLNGRLPLHRRVYACAACELELDRDLNAALKRR
jgi:putative transposase